MTIGLRRRGLIRIAVALAVLAGTLGALLLAYTLLFLLPNLPSLDSVTDYRPKIPLRVYTADNALIGEFGEEHRDFVAIKDVSPAVKNALLDIEDPRFYEHGGIDYKGALRAMLIDTFTGSFRQGASTITMQVARNFFLTKEKNVTRKLTEVLLSYRIESALSKDQILELYMNQIYMGQRTHGFSSAAKTYFGKSLNELTVAEAAMLAGIPQNPARHNPAVNPQRARQRQQLVLKRMLDYGHISQAQYEQAINEKIRINSTQQFDVHADYVAEMVRQSMYSEYKEDAYTRGFKVYTTISRAEQEAAYEALRRNVMAYDQRHGYRGPEAFIVLPPDEDARDDTIDEALQKHPASDKLQSAVVTEVTSKLVRAEPATGDTLEISGEGLRFAARALSANADRDLKIRPGAIIRVVQDAKGRWAITQLPEVDAAFVALDAQTGALHALVGGFDFNRKKFNHVTSAWRQPGSGIKPFIYSAALEKGFAPSTMINDAPISLPNGDGSGQAWEPRNDDGKYDGPVTMRTALAQSKNVVSVRILQTIGAPYARNYLPRFGFDEAKQPLNLTLTLGTGSVTPQQMAVAYAVFANGGYEVTPWLIQKVLDARGALVSETKPPEVGAEAARVIDPRNAFIIDSMLREVVKTGTGAMATQRLGRGDLAGKTGTSSDAVDGWFSGYAGNTVAVAWMGYDDPKSLGGREFGATLALPIWIDFMRQALSGKPEQPRNVPEQVSFVDGDWMYNEFVDGSGVKAVGLDSVATPLQTQTQ